MTSAVREPVSVLDPFDREDFRTDMAALASSVRDDWMRWAEQAVVIERLATQVPEERGVTHTATEWKSFVREIAVARRCSDQSAAKEIYLAVALVRDHPRTFALVRDGLMPAFNARTLLEETAGLDRELASLIDAELAERACRLTPSRVRSEVRRIELRLDADAAAARSAIASTARNIRVYDGRDDQATLVLSGPAGAVVSFYNAVNAAARAARAAGDPRGLDALRFDIATDVTPPGVTEAPAPDSGADDEPAAEVVPLDGAAALARDWSGDRRRVRPIQALIHLPVTTALGLDNEPGWLAGYGWVSAPQCREWLAIAELRQVCVARDGFVVDTADRVVRPDATPAGIRQALVDMVRNPGAITSKTWRSEPHHDPSPALARFVEIRDRYCDGPTGTRVRAEACDKDHEKPYPAGPTAAWNLKDRARRTHLLKHNGWIPLRTADSTLWFSPAGQIVEVPHHTGPPPDLDEDAYLPHPDDLHGIEQELLRPPGPDDWSPLVAPPPADDPPF
jgi:hypothetical protein